MLPNQDIRDMIRENDIKTWKVAIKLDFSDVGFSKYLRKELSEEQRAKVIRAIEEIKRNPRAWVE